MTTYDNNFRGVLFKADKDGNEGRPDYEGNAEVDGVKYWLKAWINTSKKDGKKFMSLKFQAKERHAPAREMNTDYDEADSLPF